MGIFPRPNSRQPVRSGRSTGGRSAAGPAGSNPYLYLSCTGRTVSIGAALQSPTMMMALSEDACLCIARESWRARRPHVWQLRARLRWHADGRRLHDKGERVRELTRTAFAELHYR